MTMFGCAWVIMTGYNRKYSRFHHCLQAMWCRMTWELPEAEGRVDWEKCYDDLYIAEKADVQGEIEAGR